MITDYTLQLSAVLPAVPPACTLSHTDMTVLAWSPLGGGCLVDPQNPARLAQAAAAYQVRWKRADWYKVLMTSRGEALP